ncbi:MAG: terminase large subunit domain-containing protein, partial [Rhodopila sp.]
SQDVVDTALELAGEGLSAREIQAATGTCRLALAKHLRAGQYVPRLPRIYPDSPGPQIRTTQQIVDTLTYGSRGDTNHCIPTCGALQLPDQQLPIDAWVLGYFLGNGTVGEGAVTCGSLDGVVDWPHVQEAFAGAGYDTVLRHHPDKSTVIRSARLRDELRRARVLHDKHVPLPYLRASAHQRVALLRGLMDSDGHADAVKSTVEFSSTDKHLANAVFELAASLGQKPVLTTKRAMLYGKDCGLSYRVTWRPTIQVFSLPRKANRLVFDGDQALRHHHRMIISAERIDPVPMRCLTVSSPNAMFLVGRSLIPTHNSWTGAQWVRHQIETGRRRSIALVAPTHLAGRKVMVEDGLLRLCPPDNMPTYEMATGVVRWPNGGVCHLFSSETPDRIRGYNFDAAWCDEIGAWENADDTWDQLSFALRLTGPLGDEPAIVGTTTPRNTKLLRRLLADPGTVVTRATTYDNRANLNTAVLNHLEARYASTRIGRQELLGEMLIDVPGALWTRAMMDACHIEHPPAELRRIVVAVDPAGSSNKNSDETGIIVGGIDRAGIGYVLKDLSGKYSPETWARKAIGAYRTWRADRIIAEKNFGGDMVLSTLKSVDPGVPVKLVVASRGKAIRAEPVSAQYEQGRIKHVGNLGLLEDQLCEWDPAANGPSPDRLDAAVWALTELMGRPPMSISKEFLAKVSDPMYLPEGYRRRW